MAACKPVHALRTATGNESGLRELVLSYLDLFAGSPLLRPACYEPIGHVAVVVRELAEEPIDVDELIMDLYDLCAQEQGPGALATAEMLGWDFPG